MVRNKEAFIPLSEKQMTVVMKAVFVPHVPILTEIGRHNPESPCLRQDLISAFGFTQPKVLDSVLAKSQKRINPHGVVIGRSRLNDGRVGYYLTKGEVPAPTSSHVDSWDDPIRSEKKTALSKQKQRELEERLGFDVLYQASSRLLYPGLFKEWTSLPRAVIYASTLSPENIDIVLEGKTDFEIRSLFKQVVEDALTYYSHDDIKLEPGNTRGARLIQVLKTLRKVGFDADVISREIADHFCL